MDFDKTDYAVLNALISNSRLSLRKLAKAADVSVATAMNRLKALEKNGVIKKYSAQLDYDKLNFDLQAVILLKVSKGKLFDVEGKIASHPNVCAVFDITGQYDALVLAKFKSRQLMDKFLKKIQTYDFIERTETSIILNTIKDEQVKV